MHLSELERAYWAGIVDTAGCFVRDHRNKRVFYELSGSRARELNILKKKVGGSVTHSKGRYVLRIYQQDLRSLLFQIAMHMIRRREGAEAVLLWLEAAAKAPKADNPERNKRWEELLKADLT